MNILNYLIVILSIFSISIPVGASSVKASKGAMKNASAVDSVVQINQVVVQENKETKRDCCVTNEGPAKNPLWVIDGEVYEDVELSPDDLTQLSAEELILKVLKSLGFSVKTKDIKNYTVLKPDIATSIYGERGATGAIIVTTNNNIKRNNK